MLHRKMTDIGNTNIFKAFLQQNIPTMKPRKILLLLLLAVTACTNQENLIKAPLTPTRIDSLTTNAEIEQYIGDCDSMYRKFSLQKVQDIVCRGCDTITNLDSLANRLQINFSWQKADLDNNGYTDLLATGTNKTYIPYGCSFIHPQEFNAFVIMNFGNGKTKLYDLTDGVFMSLAARIEKKQDAAFVGVYTPKLNAKFKPQRRPETKSLLTYKFDDFIEHNPTPKNHTIEKLEYSYISFGRDYKLSINGNGNTTAIAWYDLYTQPGDKGLMPEGTYTTSMCKKELYELKELLNYMDFSSLKDNYAVSWTCAPEAYYIITYDNGKTKRIYDNGAQGTYGLRILHQKLFDLWTNQQWKTVNTKKK